MDYLIVFRRDGFRFEKLIIADDAHQAFWHAEHLGHDEPQFYSLDFDLYELWYDTRGCLHLGAINMDNLRTEVEGLRKSWEEYAYGY